MHISVWPDERWTAKSLEETGVKEKYNMNWHLIIIWFQAFNVCVGWCDLYDDALTSLQVVCLPWLILLLVLFAIVCCSIGYGFMSSLSDGLEILFSFWYSITMGLHQATALCMDHCHSAAITTDESWFKTVVLTGGSACLPGLAGRSQVFLWNIFSFVLLAIYVLRYYCWVCRPKEAIEEDIEMDVIIEPNLTSLRF